MGQYKVLERLKDGLRFFERYGFWQDGDEVIDSIQSSAFQQQKYLYSKRDRFIQEIDWIPVELRENRLRSMLDTLSDYWNDSSSLLKVPLVSTSSPFKSATQIYHRESLYYAAITYYYYVYVVQDHQQPLLDFYGLFHGVDKKTLAGTISELNLCDHSDFIEVENWLFKPQPPSRSEKAQKTMDKNKEVSFAQVIARVCRTLSRGTTGLVVSGKKGGTKWEFKGDDMQYAYMALKIAESKKSRIPWKLLGETVPPPGAYDSVKHYASELKNQIKPAPLYHAVIDDAVINAIHNL